MHNHTPHWARLRQLSEAMLRVINNPHDGDLWACATSWQDMVDRVASDLECEWRETQTPRGLRRLLSWISLNGRA